MVPYSNNNEQPGVSQSTSFLPHLSLPPFHYTMNLPTATRATNFLSCSWRTIFTQNRKFTIVHGTPRQLFLNTQTTEHTCDGNRVSGISGTPVNLSPSSLQLRNTRYTLWFPRQLQLSKWLRPKQQKYSLPEFQRACSPPNQWWILKNYYDLRKCPLAWPWSPHGEGNVLIRLMNALDIIVAVRSERLKMTPYNFSYLLTVTWSGSKRKGGVRVAVHNRPFTFCLHRNSNFLTVLPSITSLYPQQACHVVRADVMMTHFTDEQIDRLFFCFTRWLSWDQI